MPDFGDGFKTAIMGPLMGLLVSAIVSALLPALIPGAGNSVAILFNFLSVLIGIASLDKANYWGILYSTGYFVGLLLIGRFFMESWEFPIYALVIGLYIFLKITKKF